MATKKTRHAPLWDSLRRREALERAERWEKKGRQKHKLAPEFTDKTVRS